MVCAGGRRARICAPRRAGAGAAAAADSILAGYSGGIKLDFYHSGLQLLLEQGKFATIEPWTSSDYEDDAAFGCPPLVFLQLVFGYRSLAEIKATYPDVWYKDKASALLIDILFPKQRSIVWTMGYT